MAKSVYITQCKKMFGLAVILLLLAGLILAFLPTVLNSSQVSASGAPEAEWAQTFGLSDYDEGTSVQQTADGGYIITGQTRSYGAGSFDIGLMKTDSEGNLIWIQVFGGSHSDMGNSVQQTADGGYIITGSTESYGAGGVDVWLIKTDPLGNIVWDKTFGGSAHDYGMSVQQTDDGGYIITGYTSSYGAGYDDAWLIKTDSSGNKEWDQTFGDSGSDQGKSVQQASDGGYIIAGRTNSYGAGSNDVWLIKADSGGDLLWHKAFGGLAPETGWSMQQTSDNGFIITGYTDSYEAASHDVLLMKVASMGDLMWIQTFGGSDNDYAWSVQQTSDGGYIITGYTESYGSGYRDVWLIKTDSSGNKEWDQTFGGSESDVGRSIQQTSDGGYIITGSTNSYGAGLADVWLIKIVPETPAITSISPGSGNQGETLDVNITGTNLTLTTDVDFGTGITVNSFTMDSSTQITVNITIDALATTGSRDVSITTPGGTATLTKGFEVNPASPTISSASPNNDIQGQTLSVIITGTYFTGTTSLSFGSGITVNSFTVDSSTQITANITIDASAATGSRDVSVTTPGGTATLTDGFTVTLPNTPTIDSVNPDEAVQGETLDVVITGTNFDGVASVSFGSGITVNNFTEDSSTQITAEVTIDTDAVTGTSDITVITPNGTSTMPDEFTVGEGEDAKEGETGGCCSSGSSNSSAAELVIGWGVIGMLWGGGYYAVRRSGKRRI